MKRKLMITALLLACVLVLTGCFCKHETWNEADCLTPKTCAECGETEGAPLGHSWQAATCSAPKSCENCDVTEGEAKGHVWEDATCIVPKKCSVCHETEGDPLGHNWEEATTEAPKTCTNCQATEGTKLNTDPRFTTAATKHLYGVWSCDVVLTGEMMGTTGYIDELPCTLIYEFGKTGDVIVTVQVNDQLAFMDGIKKMSTDVMYEALAMQGIGKEDADAAMMEAYGMTMEQYVDAYVASIDLDDIFGAMSADMVYYVTDGKLHTSDSWYGEFESSDYTLENGVLIIAEDTLEEGGEPLQWTKVEE